MIASAGEFTGVPLATVLARAGLNHCAAHVRVEGWDRGVPPPANLGRTLLLRQGPTLEKACIPIRCSPGRRTASCSTPARCAMRLLVPGWSGNWSVKWVQRIEVTAEHHRLLVRLAVLLLWQRAGRSQQRADYHIGVRSIGVSTRRSDDAPTRYAYHPWTGLEWRRVITQVEVSVTVARPGMRPTSNPARALVGGVVVCLGRPTSSIVSCREPRTSWVVSNPRRRIQ